MLQSPSPVFFSFTRRPLPRLRMKSRKSFWVKSAVAEQGFQSATQRTSKEEWRADCPWVTGGVGRRAQHSLLSLSRHRRQILRGTVFQRSPPDVNNILRELDRMSSRLGNAAREHQKRTLIVPSPFDFSSNFCRLFSSFYFFYSFSCIYTL